MKEQMKKERASWALSTYYFCYFLIVLEKLNFTYIFYIVVTTRAAMSYSMTDDEHLVYLEEKVTAFNAEMTALKETLAVLNAQPNYDSIIGLRKTTAMHIATTTEEIATTTKEYAKMNETIVIRDYLAQ
jgi:hypothetical protein